MNVSLLEKQSGAPNNALLNLIKNRNLIPSVEF